METSKAASELAYDPQTCTCPQAEANSNKSDSQNFESKLSQSFVAEQKQSSVKKQQTPETQPQEDRFSAGDMIDDLMQAYGSDSLNEQPGNLAKLMSYSDAANHQNDDDRSINQQELSAYLEKLDVRLTNSQLSALFSKMDSNDSGNIREREFNTFCNRTGLEFTLPSPNDPPGVDKPNGGDPIGDIPVEGGPVEGGPVEGGPVEGGPVDGDPVGGGPIGDIPVGGGPIEDPVINPNPPVSYANGVQAGDVDFVAPSNNGGPVVSPIFGYTWSDGLINNTFGKNADAYEWPIYNRSDMDKSKPEYWDSFVDELALARVNVISFHHRGEKIGSMNVEDLDKFIAATERAGMKDQFKIAYFEDTGMKEGVNKELAGFGSGKVDMGNPNDQKYIYEAYYKKFFETIPKEMWHTVDGRPVITSWNLIDSDYSNRQDAGKLLDYAANQFEKDFGVKPYWVLQETWIKEDPSLKDKEYLLGTHDWFSKVKGENSTYSTHNGFTTGVIAPGYSNPSDNGKYIVDREENGINRAEQSFEQGKDSDFILLEGWTGMVENIGWYRSEDWDHPNQYINIVRNASDPDPQSIRFQAEGADTYVDHTNGNTIGDHSGRGIDVRRYETNGPGSLENPASGWVVDDIQSGESVTYNNVTLGGGTYRFTGRINGMNADDQVTFKVLDSDTKELKGTFAAGIKANGEFDLHHLGQYDLAQGNYDLQLEFNSDDMQVDWFHMKKVDGSAPGSSSPTPPVSDGTTADGNAPPVDGDKPISDDKPVSDNKPVAGYKAFDSSTQMQYDTLKRGFSGSISTDGADYIAIVRSAGRDPKKSVNEDSFRTEGGKVVGITGSGDKAIMLLDTRSVSNLNIDVGESAVQFVRIRTDRDLQVDNNDRGALDPSLGEGNRLVATQSGSDMAIYADDESKYADRVRKLQGDSTIDFYNGDDSVYVMSRGENAGNMGNGSIMQISYR